MCTSQTLALINAEYTKILMETLNNIYSSLTPWLLGHRSQWDGCCSSSRLPPPVQKCLIQSLLASQFADQLEQLLSEWNIG